MKIARRNNDYVSEQGLLLSVGELHFQHSEYEKARSYFLQALALNDRIASANVHLNAYLHFILGATYNQLGQYEKAYPFLQKSLALSQSANLKDFVHLLHQALAVNYAHQGNYKAAWEHEKIHAALKDSLMNRERSEAIQRLEIQHQTVQKDMELTRQELVISQQQQAIQTRTIITGIATSATIIIALISFSLYRHAQNKQKLQANKLFAARQEQDILKKQEAINVMAALMEGEEKERRRISQELHDGIGGCLAALLMYCSSEEIANRLGPIHYREITSMLESTAEEVRDTAHNLMPDVLSRYSFADALEMHCRRMTAHSKLEIDLQIHSSPDVLTPTMQLSLYRAIQEVFQNIIKHANASQTTIQINQENDTVIVMIEDNGDGFSETDNPTELAGMGLTNIRNRIKSMGGRVMIEFSPGKGTIVQFEIPIPSPMGNA